MNSVIEAQEEYERCRPVSILDQIYINTKEAEIVRMRLERIINQYKLNEPFNAIPTGKGILEQLKFK
jgi:hypothetical protein